MPSRFEPCGLNQLYSLKYGTVPLVRATGGLADTITGFGLAKPNGPPPNGFSFEEYSPLALSETLRTACDVFHQPAAWQALVDTAMRQDWSWAASAQAVRRSLPEDDAACRPGGRLAGQFSVFSCPAEH